MTNGLIGKKLAMTQIFDEDGNFIPVTIVEVGPCTVLGVNEDKSKVTLGFGDIKEKNVAKPQKGFFNKIGVAPKRIIKEFKYDELTLARLKEEMNKVEESEDSVDSTNNVQEDSKEKSEKENTKDLNEKKVLAVMEFGVGFEIKANLFKPGDFVDVSGISIGKGFQGGMKRWGWKGGPASHGSRHHREPGSIGQCADPAKVWKGTHLPGRMGGRRVTTQCLRVMDVDAERNLLLIKGSVPGSRNGVLEVCKSFKKGWKDLEEVRSIVKHKVNPMKQSKKGK